ncbi:MAG: hypothetical protein KC472_05385 [Dehalococcoidia bacterium]|nr:hypothetical protein [Dehalococcoidia bacterium]
MLRLLGLGVVAVLLVGVGGCSAQSDGEAFYLEARVSVAVDRPGGEVLGEVYGPTETGVRWWYRDDTHFRHEYYDPSAMFEWGPRTNVAGGDVAVFYDPRLDSYSQRSLDELGGASLYPSFSAIFGPLPFETVDSFIEDWRTRVERIERVGTDEILGHRVDVYEYGPTSGASSGGAASRSGVGRFYIDPEAMIILRHTVDGGEMGPSFDAEVTVFEPDPASDKGLFDSDPPASAVRVGDNADSCPDVSSAFLAFPIPAGWTFEGSGGTSRSQNCPQWEVFAGYSRADDRMAIVQHAIPPSGLPDVRRDAQPVLGLGVEAYHLTAPDLERLVVVREGILVEIAARGATLDEMTVIAMSAE